MLSLLWILSTTLVLSALSLVGTLAFLLKEGFLKKIIFPLVAFSAGAMLAGALLHLLPEALDELGDPVLVSLWVIGGFALFFLLEQFIHWHHCHKAPSEHRHPVTYLILISDTLHNFLDGLAVGAAFMIDIRVGLVAALAIAAHEIPQELGDFGILIHGGWSKAKALAFNFFSGLAMVAGGLLVWTFSEAFNPIHLLPFAAGNFIYIAASDLIPEVKHSANFRSNLLHFVCFALGIALMWGLLLLE